MKDVFEVQCKEYLDTLLGTQTPAFGYEEEEFSFAPEVQEKGAGVQEVE